MSIIEKLYKAGELKDCPSFGANTQYEVIMGSQAYGTTLSENPDTDVYAMVIPPKDITFPFMCGKLVGFDNVEVFSQCQKHHIIWNGRQYDTFIYGILEFFRLVADNNPNMIDTLFVPHQCIVHATTIGDRIRTSRHMFLSKNCWHRFRGYAFSQLNKAKNKKPEGKRLENFEKFGYDPKFLSHVVRLMDENEQLLIFGDMDLTRSREMQKAIKRGDMPFEEVEKWFFAKERELEKFYLNEKSPLPYAPDMDKIRTLLLSCLEEYYGSLEKIATAEARAHQMMSDMRAVLEKWGY